jgi:hypothetical protein
VVGLMGIDLVWVGKLSLGESSTSFFRRAARAEFTSVACDFRTLCGARLKTQSQEPQLSLWLVHAALPD